MDVDVTPGFDLGFIVNNESRADPNNEVTSWTNGEGLIFPPQVHPELIPLLDVSFDENLSEIINEFKQSSSSAEHNHQTVASSENTAVNLNPNSFSTKFYRGGNIHFNPRKLKHSKEYSKRYT